MEQPSWTRSVTAGLLLGLAELTKFTWLILFPLWFLIWLLHITRGPSWRGFPRCAQFAQIIAIGIFVIHAGYGFDRPVWRLGEPTFVSLALAGDASPADGGEGGNRFRETPMEHLPIPLPRMLVQGVDLQRLDFDEGRWSYMAGTWRFGGWHGFYAYAALVKMPLGTLALILLGCLARGSGDALRWSVVLVTGMAVFILVSTETGFTRFFRYLLPALPFAYIWAARSAGFLADRWGRLVVAGTLLATVGSSLWVWPHSLSYFNGAAGGPRNGWRHLLDANLDWGQDLPALAEWQRKHPEATPLFLETYWQLAPEIHGLRYHPIPTRPTPGWYAVGKTQLSEPNSPAQWLRRYEPADKIGYSLVIFHVTSAEIETDEEKEQR